MQTVQPKVLTLRVTVLYQLPLNPQLDRTLMRLSSTMGGKFIGSGSDGAERDLAFDFADSKEIHDFIDIVVKTPGCHVLVFALDEEETEK